MGAGETVGSAAGDDRGTWSCEDSIGWIRFARGVIISVGCVVSGAPSICVGCVA